VDAYLKIALNVLQELPLLLDNRQLKAYALNVWHASERGTELVTCLSSSNGKGAVFGTDVPIFMAVLLYIFILLVGYLLTIWGNKLARSRRPYEYIYKLSSPNAL
jgi:hypothetical protein